jgi:arylsulfatase A-like enzyme
MNVIGIVLDTFRSDIIGPDQKLGFVETPRLDALEAESVVFRNAFGEGQPTLQCRRSFYTGRRSFPWVHNYDRRGHWHHQPGWHKIPPEQDTIAEILLERGYRTGLVSDVYHMFKPTMNYWRGFLSYDFIRGQESDNWVSGPLDSVREQAARHSLTPEPIVPNALLYQYLLNQRFRQGEEDYQCARVFRSAAQWLDDNAGEGSPFFLWVEAFDPHEPWDPRTEYADRYCANTTGIDYILPRLPKDPSEADIERTKALYYGEASFVDRWVGHLLDKVNDLNLWDDTIVLVLSDHGTQVWDHGKFGKGGGDMRRYNTGIVWQMRVPGVAAKRLEPIVQAHDVMPTLLELLDVPYARCDGQSVMPLVRGEIDCLRERSVIGWAGPGNGNAGAFASVRTPRWNYCTPTHCLDQDVLYDLASDPDESVDVKADHADLVREFQREIEAVVGQPLPAKLNEVCDPETFPMLKHFRLLAKRC